MNIKDYDRLLESHDWHYDYSDDIQVYQRGREREEELKSLAKLSPQHQLLWDGYVTARSETHSLKIGSAEHKSIGTRLNAVRVQAGAVTQQDLLNQEIAERQREERKEHERLERLRKYNQECARHDWWYWKERYDSPAYQEGSQLRQRLWLEARWGTPEDNPYTALFRAWAAYHNAQTQVAFEAAEQALIDLQQNLKVMP